MAALAPGRTALLTIAVLGMALLVGGCRMKDGRSQIAGVELVEQQGAAVAGWSPDSRWIAFPSPGGIGLRRPDGTGRRTIEAPPIGGEFGRPAPIEWSGQDRFLRYVTTFGPERGLGSWATRIRPDGSGLGQVPLLQASGGRPEEPVLSADGRRVIFKLQARGARELWVANADGTGARRLARFSSLRNYRFSPDGRRIALTAAAIRGSGGIFVVPAAGGKPRLVSDEVVNGPTWSPNGRWLTYSTADGEVRRIHPDGSSDETIAEFGDEEVRGLVWSPNGRYLLYSTRPFPNEYFD